MDRNLRGLGPDERLVARAAASFRGASAVSMRSTFALGSARRRAMEHAAWSAHAEAAGFPSARPDMVLALTDSRLVVCRTSFWLGRADAIQGDVPLTRIFDVATVRHGIVTGLAFAFTNGQIVEVEAVRGRQLRRFADAMQAVLQSGRR